MSSGWEYKLPDGGGSSLAAGLAISLMWGVNPHQDRENFIISVDLTGIATKKLEIQS